MSELQTKLIEPTSARDRVDLLIGIPPLQEIPQTGMKVPFYWDDHLGAWLSMETIALPFGRNSPTPGNGENLRVAANGIDPGSSDSYGFTVPFNAVVVAMAGASDDDVAGAPTQCRLRLHMIEEAEAAGSDNEILNVFWPDGDRTVTVQALYHRVPLGAQIGCTVWGPIGVPVPVMPRRPRVEWFLKWIIEASECPSPK